MISKKKLFDNPENDLRIYICAGTVNKYRVVEWFIKDAYISRFSNSDFWNMTYILFYKTILFFHLRSILRGCGNINIIFLNANTKFQKN